jgi:hypothetical protein
MAPLSAVGLAKPGRLPAGRWSSVGRYLVAAGAFSLFLLFPGNQFNVDS